MNIEFAECIGVFVDGPDANSGGSQQDNLYREASTLYGPALERVARAYETDEEKRRDLLQDISIGLWRSLASFDGRCSLRTWVYRVAHNTAISHIIRSRLAAREITFSLDDVGDIADDQNHEAIVDQRRTLDRLFELIQRLKPIDRQVLLLYLEGIDAAAIGEITGLSPSNVSTKVHRIKAILVRRFHEGGRDDG